MAGFSWIVFHGWFRAAWEACGKIISDCTLGSRFAAGNKAGCVKGIGFLTSSSQGEAGEKANDKISLLLSYWKP
jgi:hypothetical protein